MEPGPLERILEASYLDGVESWETPRLRVERTACEAAEEAVSYARRLLQGRLDILRAELMRRRDAGSDAAEDLLADLPTILTGDERAELRTDAVHARVTRLRIPPDTAMYERRIDAIADTAMLSRIRNADLEQVETLIDELAAYERELSGVRRELFGRIDRLRDELAARYKDGRATVRDLLGDGVD